MLKHVHHVHYVVGDLDEMVRYLEKNFGLKPDQQTGYEDRDVKEALYTVGKTTIQISQPLDPESSQGKFLATKGPGVLHVAWAVDNIRQVAKDLAAKGSKLRGKDGITDSPHGYHTINIDLASTQGLWLQLAEGERKVKA